MRGALFKWPPQAQFLTKSKNCLEIIFGFEIVKKVFPSLSYGQSKFGVKLWRFLIRFYTNPSLFLAFTIFTSIMYFFWSFPFKPPFENFLGGVKNTLSYLKRTRTPCISNYQSTFWLCPNNIEKNYWSNTIIFYPSDNGLGSPAGCWGRPLKLGMNP